MGCGGSANQLWLFSRLQYHGYKHRLLHVEAKTRGTSAKPQNVLAESLLEPHKSQDLWHFQSSLETLE